MVEYYLEKFPGSRAGDEDVTEQPQVSEPVNKEESSEDAEGKVSSYRHIFDQADGNWGSE